MYVMYKNSAPTLHNTLKLSIYKLHGYTVHQIMLNTFYYQLTHTTLKNVELLKHSKINKNAPTCFGLLLTKSVTFSQVLPLAP